MAGRNIVEHSGRFGSAVGSFCTRRGGRGRQGAVGPGSWLRFAHFELRGTLWNILEHWGGRRWVCFARLGVCDGQAGSDGRVGAFGHCARGREGCGGGTRLRCEWMHGPSPYCRVSYNAYLTDCKVKVVAFKFFFGEGGCVRDWLFVAKKQRIKEAKGVRILN
jgi:hypothetical protein